MVLTEIVANRLAGLRVVESSLRHRAETDDIYLNEAERMVMRLQRAIIATQMTKRGPATLA